MRKELSHVMLELQNVKMEPSSVRKKIREPPNVTKESSHVKLELHNVRMEPSNVKKKSKATTKCDKRTITRDVGTAQCEDEIVKCKQKLREPPNVRKELSHVILKLHNVRMESSSVRKK